MNITNDAATCNIRPGFLNCFGRPFGVSRTSRAFDVRSFQLPTSLARNTVIVKLGASTGALSTDGI